LAIELSASEISGRVWSRWLAFRARSAYFQLKTLVLVCYAAVVGATVAWVLLFPGGLQAGKKNQIGASILTFPGDPVVGRYFVIENQSGSHWKQVRFEIDGGYGVEMELLPAGEKVTLYVRDFKKRVIRRRRGREIPKTVRARVDRDFTELRVTCSEGEAVEPLAPPEKSLGESLLE
jgi:hypothetical protein